MVSTTFELETLSESTDGMPIVITGTSTGSPTDLHVSSLTSDEHQEVYLTAHMVGTTEASLYLQLDDGGGAVRINSADRGKNQSAVLILDGHTIGDGITVSAYGSSSGVWVVYGRVHKVTNE